MAEDLQFDIRGLENVMKAFKGRLPKLQIGILGDTARRPNSKGQGGGVSNALVGAVHEFGAPGRNIPQRSFLRVPLANHLHNEVESSGLLDKEVLVQVVKTGSVVPWLKKIGIVAEGIVSDAFDTAGDGTWPAWKNPGYTNEGGQLLVDSQQLRDAVTSEVKS